MVRNGINLLDCDIRCCDELMVEDGYINATYELWFDVEKFFGIKLDDDSWINLYTDWYPNGDLKITVHIDSDNGITDIPFELTEEEKRMFINKMESYCMKYDNMSLLELYEEYNNEEIE